MAAALRLLPPTASAVVEAAAAVAGGEALKGRGLPRARPGTIAPRDSPHGCTFRPPTRSSHPIADGYF